MKRLVCRALSSHVTFALAITITAAMGNPQEIGDVKVEISRREFLHEEVQVFPTARSLKPQTRGRLALVFQICAESSGISVATFYKWRAKFGGMDTSMMARMKELEEENRRLRKMYVEEKLKAEIATEVPRKSKSAVSSARMAKRLSGVWVADSFGARVFDQPVVLPVPNRVPALRTH